MQKRIEEAEIQHRDEPIAVTTNIFSSPISEEIQECEFPRKFTIPTFDAYSSYELSDPTSLTLPRQDGGLFPEQPPYVSNLGVASDWFYFLSPRSIHNFECLAKLFLSQYSSRREFKKNNNHLLTSFMGFAKHPSRDPQMVSGPALRHLTTFSPLSSYGSHSGITLRGITWYQPTGSLHLPTGGRNPPLWDCPSLGV